MPRIIGVILWVVTGFFLTSSFVEAAQDGCRPFPKVALWGNMSHESVRSHVDRKLQGDWDSYISQLEKVKARLQDIHGRGKAVRVSLKDRKVTLRGKKLRDYIKLSQNRIAIAICLAEEAEGAGISTFATAAGTPEEPLSTRLRTPSIFGEGKKTKQLQPAVRSNKRFRTYISLSEHVGIKLRQRAAKQSLIEDKNVSVKDIIVRTLEKEFGRKNR